jgi:membrane protein
MDHCEGSRPSHLHRFAHFWLLVVKSFVRNRCPLRASALAYTTLLALIPLLAVGISVSASFLQKEGEKPVRELIDKLVANVAPALNLSVNTEEAPEDDKRHKVVTEITNAIGRIRSGTLGVASTVALIFVAIGLLRTIEATFNDIWGITHGRGWVASIVQYWATVSLGPLVLILVIGLTTGAHYKATEQWVQSWPWVGTLVFQLLPYVVLSLAFGLFYQLMPNTRVQWQAALVGGVVGGCLWQVNNKLHVLYASNAVTYSKVYGPLALIPLFLIGMYFSWLILLLGAQVAYAFQNREAYVQERQAERVNQRGREFIALRLVAALAQRFHGGELPVPATELATAIGVPTRLAGQILQTLVRARLLLEVSNGEEAYTPARPLDKINAHEVLTALRCGQGQELATRDEPTRAAVRAEFDKINEAERKVAEALTLAQMAEPTVGPPDRPEQRPC